MDKAKRRKRAALERRRDRIQGLAYTMHWRRQPKNLVPYVDYHSLVDWSQVAEPGVVYDPGPDPEVLAWINRGEIMKLEERKSTIVRFQEWLYQQPDYNPRAFYIYK